MWGGGRQMTDRRQEIGPEVGEIIERVLATPFSPREARVRLPAAAMTLFFLAKAETLCAQEPLPEEVIPAPIETASPVTSPKPELPETRPAPPVFSRGQTIALSDLTPPGASATPNALGRILEVFKPKPTKIPSPTRIPKFKKVETAKKRDWIIAGIVGGVLLGASALIIGTLGSAQTTQTKR